MHRLKGLLVARSRGYRGTEVRKWAVNPGTSLLTTMWAVFTGEAEERSFGKHIPDHVLTC